MIVAFRRFGKQRNGLLAILSPGYNGSGVLQQGAGDFKINFIVFHNQNLCAGQYGGLFRFRLVVVLSRQLYHKRRNARVKHRLAQGGVGAA